MFLAPTGIRSMIGCAVGLNSFDPNSQPGNNQPADVRKSIRLLQRFHRQLHSRHFMLSNVFACRTGQAAFMRLGVKSRHPLPEHIAIVADVTHPLIYPRGSSNPRLLPRPAHDVSR